MIKRIEVEQPTIFTILTIGLGLAFQSSQQNNQPNGCMDTLNGRMDALDARLRAVEQSQARIATLLEERALQTGPELAGR